MNSIHHLRTPDRTPSGFALVTTLLLLALLVVVMGALASFVSVSQRSAGAEGKAYSAQQSALVGLNVALGELQAAAGPDQRVTATASILGHTGNAYAGGTTPTVGRAAWTGVWKSNTNDAPDGEAAQYSPKFPDTKTFAGWLVSATDVDGNFTLPGNLTDVSAASYALDDSMTLFAKPDGSAYIEAGMVHIDDVRGGKRYFAFAVEDEGVKADLSWSETPASLAGTERAQASRLSAAPGPDYAMLNGSNGPFGSVTHPLTIDSNPFLSDAIAPMRDPADLQTSLDANPEWLKEQRADITWGSRGVLADVKLGGLRRDLSLAFEMDGDADVTASEQPTLFNLQVGEFVGGSDKLASGHDCPGMPVRERYLFRETRETGGPFADQVYLKTSWLSNRDQAVVRGPTWWNLRDYSNLYKRLEKSGSDYKLKARAYYPDRSTIGYAHSDMLDTIRTWADHRDTDYRKPFQGMFKNQWKYIFRPARPNYAPVNLGTTSLISVIATNYDPGTQTADIAIAIDPIFYFWNPYNRELEVDNLAVYFETGFPGTVHLTITKNANTATPETTEHDVDIWRLLFDNFDNYHKNSHARYWGKSYSFLINASSGSNNPIVFAPGEVVAASPSSTSGQSYLGYDPLNNDSGIIMATLWNVSNRVSVVPGATKINIGYYKHASSGFNAPRFFIDTQMTPQGTTPQDLAGSKQILGDQTQSTHMQLTAKRWEHVAESAAVLDVPIDLNTLLNVKQQFGLFTYLMKPANWSGSRPNPVEIFSRFNPAPLVVNKDWWAAAAPNMVYNFVADQNPNNLINNNGLNFSASARNAFWGKSYDSSGSTAVPMSNVPSSPLLSLADFAHANLGTMAENAFHAVGNSWATAVISPLAPYGTVNTGGGGQTHGTGTDLSWHCNDALFDRYYLSGIAPDFTIGTGGYSATGSISATLNSFYGTNPSAAKANPVLMPYLPGGKSATDVVTELTPIDAGTSDAYKKLAAYSLIDGVFNVNSTSVEAWTALLRANRDVDVDYAQGGGTNTASGSPFPSSAAPSAPGNGAKPYWSGLSRISDAQIDTLAQNIVEEIRKRGPFMSLSDFVNRKVGGTALTNEHRAGALQTAINNVGVNSTVHSGAGGTNSDYRKLDPIVKWRDIPNGNTARDVPMEITQADLLRPLAPRLSARSDTFRIRSYGEVRSRDGTRIISKAMCEAIVQRVPEYMDSDTDEAWVEGTALGATNQKFGRRFKVVQLRWLAPDEI